MKTVTGRSRITDAELVLLIRKRDVKGAEALYDSYANFLFFAIKRIIPERELSERTLQETFKEIWNTIADYDIQRERIYTWMFAIARRTALAAIAETKKHEKSE